MLEPFTATQSEHRALNLLNAPVWIISSRESELIFANEAAERLSSSLDLRELRHCSYSAHAEEQFSAYLPALRAQEPIIEIWTGHRNEESVPLSCQLSLLDQDSSNT